MAASPITFRGDRSPVRTLDLLGTPLCLTTYDEFAQRCREIARCPGTAVVDFSNTQIVTMRRHDPGFFGVTREFDYFVPDGMPLVWCLNLRGAHLKDRVYGPTFMRHLVSDPTPGYTHYLIGGSVECVTRLKEELLRRNPQAQIVGARHGYFKREEEPSIVEEINRLSPDFVWVGLGTPKQQEWICRNRPRLHRGVLFAVGFAFDVNAGTKRDAPPWMQRTGTTWLFRLLHEPRRLGPRYLRYNSLFVSYLLWDGVRGRAWAGATKSDRD